MESKFIQELTETVDANLHNEHFGPEELAAKMGMSHSALHRKIKSKYNKTISLFIRERRLEKSKELLLNENLSVSEIAYKVGFGSATYFNKCFHEFLGVSPGEYRKKPENNPDPDSEDSNAKELHKKRFPVYAYFVPFVIIAFIALVIFKGNWFKKEIPLEKSVAVLPVEYLGHPEFSYQGRGARADIINHLSRIHDLVVFETDSVFNQQSFMRNISAGYYLKLTYLNEAQDILIYACLMRGDNRQIIWNERFHREKEEIFKIYSEVADAIADKTGATITPRERYLIEQFSTLNLTAYDYYMQARDLVWNYEITGDTLLFHKARNLLRNAIQLDSCCAPAYVGISSLYMNYNWWRKFFADDPMDSALFYANKAIYHDKTLAEAYRCRGDVYAYQNHLEEARNDFNKAIELNPSDWMAYFRRGQSERYDWLLQLKDFHKALSLCNSKEKINIIRNIGIVYMRIGFYEIAEFYYKKVIDLDKDSLSYVFFKASKAFSMQQWDDKLEQDLLKIYLSDSNSTSVLEHLAYCKQASGDYEKALYYFLRIKKILGNREGLMHHITHRLGYLYWMTGDYKMANQCFDLQIKYTTDVLKEQRPWWKVRYYDLATVYAFRNERDSAYKYLHEFNSAEYSMAEYFGNFIKVDPLFENIRYEAEFQKIVAEVEYKNLVLKEQVKQWLVENKLYEF
ncbi:helix-turn-helix domain-containing protein [Mariniphaga sp.]|uniref:helix-turn-helix domain-containing protein n=1 Tax=Mariniphaga sp. TaxID=1954475 RepID=UPI003562BE0D